MDRKGISPLIAAVLLIAFTMAVAGILTAWVTTFTQDTADQTGEAGEELLDCSSARVRIQDAYFNNDTSDVSVVVTNEGSVPFEEWTEDVGREVADPPRHPGLRVSVFEAGGGVNEAEIGNLTVGESSSVTFDKDYEYDDVTDARVASTACSGVTDEAEILQYFS